MPYQSLLKILELNHFIYKALKKRIPKNSISHISKTFRVLDHRILKEKLCPYIKKSQVLKTLIKTIQTTS
jgi:hypothetical protein